MKNHNYKFEIYKPHFYIINKTIIKITAITMSHYKVVISSDSKVKIFSPSEDIWPHVNRSSYRPDPIDKSLQDADLTRITCVNTSENAKKGQFKVPPYCNYILRVSLANTHYDKEFEGVSGKSGNVVVGKRKMVLPERLLSPYQNELLLVDILEKYILNGLIATNDHIILSILDKYPNITLEKIIEVNNTVEYLYERLEKNNYAALYHAGVNLKPVHQKYLKKLNLILLPYIEITLIEYKEFNILLNNCNNYILNDLEILYNNRDLLTIS